VWDKLLHTGGYMPLGWLCVRAVTDRFRNGLTLRAGVTAWGIATLYAASDEGHQSFVPLREMDAGDFAADAIGAALSVIACVVWSRVGARRAVPSTIEPSKPRTLELSNP
jgi:VanZ family protein